MTPELHTTLTAITQICLAHSAPHFILSRNEYNNMIQALAARTDLATLTPAEWITFYDGLPNAMRFNRAADESGFSLHVPAITDKTGFFYDIIISTFPSLRTAFVALVPQLLTRLQTQNAEFDHGDEDDLDIIYAIENILSLLIPHAIHQDELHQWYEQGIELLNVSATVSEAVHNILNLLAYQIVSLPNSLESFKTYLTQLKDKARETELTDEQENALYRGYAVIAV